MANDKVFSVRADEETIERLNGLADESGMKKAEILPALIAAFEANKVRDRLPGRAAELDNLRNLLQQVEHAYVACLEYAANTEQRVRADFLTRIENNEQAVASLKEKAKAAEDKATEATAAAKSLQEERDQLAESLTVEQGKTQEQAERIDELKETKDSLKQERDALKAQIDSIPVIEQRAEAAEAKVKELESEVAKEKAEKEQAILDAKIRHADEIKALTERHNQKQQELKERFDEQNAKLLESLTNTREKYEGLLDAAEARHAKEIERIENSRRRTTKKPLEVVKESARKGSAKSTTGKEG